MGFIVAVHCARLVVKVMDFASVLAISPSGLKTILEWSAEEFMHVKCSEMKRTKQSEPLSIQGRPEIVPLFVAAHGSFCCQAQIEQHGELHSLFGSSFLPHGDTLHLHWNATTWSL